MAITTETVDAIFLLRELKDNELETYKPYRNEPVLGVENDRQVIKFGDGENLWKDLKGFGTQDILDIKEFIAEHGGEADAIELENEEFNFKVNNEIVSHTTGNQAAGLVFTPIYNALYETDKMELPYWGNLAVGKSIRINNTYSSAFGSYHNIEATGAFVTGIHNTILRNTNYKGQYAVVMGQAVGAMGNASFSSGFGSQGACQAFFETLKNTENPVLIDIWKGTSTDRGKRPAIAVGNYSARFGMSNASLGTASFAAGGYNVASGNYSFTAGENTQSLGNHSCTFGHETIAIGEGSMSFGKSNQAQGNCSFVGGYNNYAIGNYATAFGQNNNSSGTNSFSVGRDNVVSGSSAIAIGNNNYVSNQYSFSAGLANLLVNKQSFALGSGLQSSNTGEVLLGYLNKKVNNALLIVGNGSGNIEKCKIQDGKMVDPEGTVRSNAFVVYKDGHAELTKDDWEKDNCIPTVKSVKQELAKKANAEQQQEINSNFEQAIEINASALSGLADDIQNLVSLNNENQIKYNNLDSKITNLQGNTEELNTKIERLDKFYLQTGITEGRLAESGLENYVYSADWTENWMDYGTNDGADYYQVTGLITIGVQGGLEEPQDEIQHFSLPELIHYYNLGLRKILVSFNGYSGGSYFYSTSVCLMPSGDEEDGLIPTIMFDRGISLSEGETFQITIQFTH